MKKRFAAGILTAALLVGGATAALGATEPDKLSEIKGLYQQMFNLQKEIADKEAAAGMITPDQAAGIKNNIGLKSQSNSQALDNGIVPNMGLRGGRGGMGMGLNGGQPLTQEQIDAMNALHQQRLDQYNEAVKNGTITPGQFAPGYGIGGMRGGRFGGQGQFAVPPVAGFTSSN